MVLLMGLLAVLCLSEPARAEEWTYIVQPGDNLWNLARELTSELGYWRRLQRLNRVEQPRRLQPGTHLRIPMEWLRVHKGSAHIRSVQGRAVYLPAGTKHPKDAAPGLELHPGDRLRTAQGGHVHLRLKDGSDLHVYQDTELILDRLNHYGDSEHRDYLIGVPRGRVEAVVPTENGGNDRFRIRTPAAVTAVRGTDLRVHMDEAEHTARTEVVHGRVTVSAAGRRVHVPAAHGIVVRKGRPPAPPRPLLPSPDLSQLNAPLRRLPLELHWPSLPGASAYRLRVTRQDRPDHLLADLTVKRSHSMLPDLPDGRYVLTMRAIDAQGLEGLEARRALEIDARPVPPFLMAPRHDSVVRTERVAFEWSQAGEAEAYHLQVAQEPHFGNPLVDRVQATNRYRPKASWPAGTYFWRVATRTDGEEGPFSDAQRFDLRPAPEAPGQPEVEADKDTVTFRWRAGKPGQRYQFQMARDAAFKEILLDRILTEPQITLPRPEQPRVYLRTRILDVDGYPGPFGPPQHLDKARWPGWPVLGFGLLVLLLAL